VSINRFVKIHAQDVTPAHPVALDEGIEKMGRA
jgi:hypothetical protein